MDTQQAKWAPMTFQLLPDVQQEIFPKKFQPVFSFLTFFDRWKFYFYFLTFVKVALTIRRLWCFFNYFGLTGFINFDVVRYWRKVWPESMGSHLQARVDIEGGRLYYL